MPRKARSVGPNTLALIEDARIDLARAVLDFREDKNEPEFKLPQNAPDLASEEGVYTYRQQLIEALSEFSSDELQPAEQRCGRICALANGKGVTSLTTIVEQRLDAARSQVFARQPDRLCRSIWAYLYARDTFEDAESFHFARQYRDHGKLYDAFEVELENHVALNAVAIDEPALAAGIKKMLELKPDISCTVKALDLPATDTRPASIMVIVRHGGPLSSVYDHRQDGRRGTIYYRPPNEATLIYTPSLRQIEVCADSPVLRQVVSDSFAGIALRHDISEKPLTWKRYNLSRFRTSLSLQPPEIDGYEFKFARVVEAEIWLGRGKRKLRLKVTIEDDIENVADRYLGTTNVFRCGESFSRIAIAVAYNRVGDEKERTLNITIAGTKSCNLQSKTDPEERSLGFDLLKEWGILSAFRQIATEDLRAIFPQLLQLHDRIENEVSGAYLSELGLDASRLIEGGLLERHDRQNVVLLEEDDIEGEGAVTPSVTKGMVRTVGPFGEDAGKRPASEIEMYAVNAQWLRETLMRLLKPLLSKRVTQVLDPDLTILGAMDVDGADVPMYFARRLNDLKTAQRLDLALRARHAAGVGIVLSASADGPGFLGPNLVIPVSSCLSSGADDIVVSRDALELAYRTNHPLAQGGATLQLRRSGTQSATLHIPGKAPLIVSGYKQLLIIERLVSAHNSGQIEVRTGDVIADTGVLSPTDAWPSSVRKSVAGVYIENSRRGHWRLKMD